MYPSSLLRILRAACAIGGLACIVLDAPTAGAQNLPKIAVTDLSYEEQVKEYFQYFEAREKHDNRSSSSGQFRDSANSSSGSASERSSSRGESSVVAASGSVTVISRGELRKFTADIKGELLKSGSYRLVQGKPWTQQNTEKLYDIIARIKQGYYLGADYVLFGSINNVDFRQETHPIQGSNAVSFSLALELVGEFSLINTRTYEIKAAFSAMGEGSDTRLANAAGTRIALNKSKVMQEVSRSLGDAVASEMEAQFNPAASTRASRAARNAGPANAPAQEERTVVFK
ncbi:MULTISPECIES: penicillin-binding protein activator LpoB [unclassified Herbaspirillum]|uniref:penicillin-binding protein activator LpoB n=1 Tax=unclassified Herbaspirillum TaxID=2624150 RepID=UPI00114E1AED|nr:MULTISPECIES: penicillin-binding protein activator LpoB [unclassified Herbaspirillum]MBB5392963.1 hypothetical protein [Herbaspirillum sp. SJZ102]TQK04392.1 peptidoglycan-synthase activator LpoB [Herbaspirillum sp. SJZ130]TQK09823.1 peptidoglycan-synthase activator LpoB [Herbaspirillum sp. SJZ106]TWC65827.1 peptidoglycan-synthase activator LpoB [Herbaspirillum sp. SJZ099]